MPSGTSQKKKENVEESPNFTRRRSVVALVEEENSGQKNDQINILNMREDTNEIQGISKRADQTRLTISTRSLGTGRNRRPSRENRKIRPSRLQSNDEYYRTEFITTLEL